METWKKRKMENKMKNKINFRWISIKGGLRVKFTAYEGEMMKKRIYDVTYVIWRASRTVIGVTN